MKMGNYYIAAGILLGGAAAANVWLTPGQKERDAQLRGACTTAFMAAHPNVPANVAKDQVHVWRNACALDLGVGNGAPTRVVWDVKERVPRLDKLPSALTELGVK